MLNVRPRLDARLPATRVTPEMRDEMVELARQHRCDLGELQRAAFSLFLQQNGTNSVTKDTINTNSGLEQEQAS